ncbi:Rho guanine nucleotide exchange factor [Sporothrix epigloea]|uniref:Rho guanine nucleotide exchange factor n=1 Tax=Sporothrix epigloea TaxID=1892477 RepID=A0ABP0E5F4_9PEZI
MSFRSDGQRRYGHIPPVQYPIANQHPPFTQHQQLLHEQQYTQQLQHDQSQHPVRRPSFNDGDDNSYISQQQVPPPHQLHHARASISSRGEEELFLEGPANSQPLAPPIPAKPAAYGNRRGPEYPAKVVAEYQDQLHAAPTQYNPQSFAPSQSQTLPYRPQSSARLASPAMPSFPSCHTRQASKQQQQQQNHIHATYNPAAYASHQGADPQVASNFSGYSNNQQLHSYNTLAAPLSPEQVPTTPCMNYHNDAVDSAPSPSAYRSPKLHLQDSYQPRSYYKTASSATATSSQSSLYGYQGRCEANCSTSGNYNASTNTVASFSANNASSVPSPASILNDAVSQAPHPTLSQISSLNSLPNEVNSPSRSSSTTSSAPLPPVHYSFPPELIRHPTNAPLPGRPPTFGTPEESIWHSIAINSFTETGCDQNLSHDHITQDSLFHDIEANLGFPSSNDGDENGNLHSPLYSGECEISSDNFFRRNSSTSSYHPSTNEWTSATSAVDRASPASALSKAEPSTYCCEDDSDPEGALGLYEMQQADLNEQRFSISGPSTVSAMTNVYDQSGQQHQQFPQYEQPMRTDTRTSFALPQNEQTTSDSEFFGMDIGLFSGGYAGNLKYGNLPGNGSSMRRSSTSATMHSECPPQSSPPRPYESNSRYAPFAEAEMDYGDTGGLQPPILHRLSSDDGDERVSLHSGLSGSESPTKDQYPDMFYHPGISSRPLPALPPDLRDTRSSINHSLQPATLSDALRLSYQQPTYPRSFDSQLLARFLPQQQQTIAVIQNQQYQQQLHVERSTSMSSHSTTPVLHLPGRSRTDAAEERKKSQRQLAVQYEQTYNNTLNATSISYDIITLPTGRRKKFLPSKLTPDDYSRCREPWALSSIAEWVREMADGEPDLKRKTIEDGLVALFTTKVSNMNVADAETLAENVTDTMFSAGILIPEEEWVKFGPGGISGVLWQLTGSGCYAPFAHSHVALGRCYSYYCTRTLRKANLDEMMSEVSARKEDWVTYYKITKDMIESKPRKEVERQNVLHEIVTSEEEYNNQLDVLRVLYKNQLRHWQPPIIPPNRLDKFINTVFCKVESMQRVNKDYLLAQLKYRQNEQGPWIAGFSDIFREWIRKARDDYIAYSTDYPNASFAVRKEAARNVLFRQFLEHVRNHKRSDRLGWDTFLKAPITRLQRYSLLLSTVYKNTVQDSEEKVNLARAIEEIRVVTKECDRLVDEMGKKVSLQELQSQLVFRPGSQIILNLDHLGRELLLQGDLQRMGSKGVRWVDTHTLLFDHYFILAKAVSSKDDRGSKKYDVSKEPIPIPLLILESKNDDPISKQKGLATPLARTTTATTPDVRTNKSIPNNASGRPELEHTMTAGSANSGISRLNSGTPGEEGKILYPFRVKHLGHEVYTLYAATPQSRQEWCNKIIEAKTRHARALLQQNAEPFRLRVVADGAFAYDSVTAIGKQTSISIRGTPLDQSIRGIEQIFGPGQGPAPVCRATVNCATSFMASGKTFIAIGTDFGVYISDASNPRGWTRSIQINKVTQIAVLEEFSVCLVLADKALISYPLDVIATVSAFPAPNINNARRAPQRLAKDVSFFATARMKDRMLLFYKKKEGLHNMFKVLEPVFQKASEKKSRLFSGSRRSSNQGTTESFRDFDEFYLPTECFSLNLFQTYVAVSTAKGIVMLTLDRKQTMSVPRDLAAPATANIAARIRDQRPLGMFRLNDQEFLLAYEDCAVYADKHGEVSRTLIMEYSGKQKKARAATMYGQYLLLFNDDYIEVRNAENGRLRQIIAGNDVRCLDHGFRGPTGSDNATAMAATPINTTSKDTSALEQHSKGTVKISMTHPEASGMQIVLELLLNDEHSEMR